MRLRTFFLIFLCCLSMLSCADGSLHDSDGRRINTSYFKNKWIIVNYWAGWCESCVKEIPELNHLYRKYQDKNILVLGVNFDQLQSSHLKRAIQNIGIDFPVLLEDPNFFWRLGQVSILPTTFIIHPSGRVVKKIIGPNTEQSLLNILHGLDG